MSLFLTGMLQIYENYLKNKSPGFRITGLSFCQELFKNISCSNIIKIYAKNQIYYYIYLINHMKKIIKVYTDGACSGTPGDGGWSAIIKDGENTTEIFGGLKNTTNNRMEIMAVLKALIFLKGRTEPIIIYSDSRYVVNSIEEWLPGWVKKNFEGKKNKDLWREIWLLKQENKHVHANWVKGHSGHPINERCDELAVAAKSLLDNPIDHVCKYEYSLVKTS